MTQTLIKKKDNGPVVCFSLVQAGFWMSFCISVSFASVYLQAIGCSNSLLGLILALGNLSGAILALALADWIDRNAKISAKHRFYYDHTGRYAGKPDRRTLV